MVPAYLQEKLTLFVEQRRPVIAGLIKQVIASGRSPEDMIFVLPAGDDSSQEVTGILFGLEDQAAAGPLPKGFVVGQDDFFATVGRTFEKCEPDVSRVLRTRTYGEAKLLAVVDGYFCGVGLMYRTHGPLPVA